MCDPDGPFEMAHLDGSLEQTQEGEVGLHHHTAGFRDPAFDRGYGTRRSIDDLIWLEELCDRRAAREGPAEFTELLDVRAGEFPLLARGRD